MSYRPSLSFPSVTFTKTAAQIKSAIENQKVFLQTKQTALKTEVETICKRWDMSPDEVFAAGDNRELINAYSNKMSSSLGATNGQTGAPMQMSRNIVESMQVDVSRLSYLGSKHAERKRSIEELTVVSNNLDDSNEKFKLTFSELATLGFK